MVAFLSPDVMARLSKQCVMKRQRWLVDLVAQTLTRDREIRCRSV